MITEEELKELETIYRNNGTVGKEGVLALIAELRRLYAAYAAVKAELSEHNGDTVRVFSVLMLLHREFDPEGYAKGLNAINKLLTLVPDEEDKS